MLKATNIQWDTNEDEFCDNISKDDLNLPTEIIIPKEIEDELEENEDAISNYLSDTTGFCHYGFDLEEI